MSVAESTKCALPARLRLVAVAAIVSSSCATAWAGPVWWKNIPDEFQHQMWGAKPGDNPPPLAEIKGSADPGGDGLSVVDVVGGNKRLLSWELSGVFNPPFKPPFDDRKDKALASFNGWCNIATDVNLFYYFKQKGFAVTTGAVTKANDLHKEVRALANDMWRLDATTPDLTKDLNKVLEARSIDPTKVRDGLTAQNYKQEDGSVTFMSSTGVEKELPKTTLFDHLQTAFKFGDAASLRLGYDGDPGKDGPQNALWWRGPFTNPGALHSVAVSGFDTADKGTIWFADPDSNPKDKNAATGNKNSDAGWSEAGALGTFDPASSDNWLAAPGNTVPVKQRRFAADAGVPKPAGDTPTQAEQDRLYFKGTLNDNKTEFKIADADYKRYDTVKIRYLETLEAVKAGKKPREPGAGFAAGDGGIGAPFTFQVSPGQSDTGPDPISGKIDQFYLFPSSAEQLEGISNLRVNGSTVPATVLSDPNAPLMPNVWNISMYGPNSVDPWGNGLPWGGVSVRAGAGVSALSGLDLFEFDYTTEAASQLSAWDFFYNNSMDPGWASLGVQTLGGGYDLPVLQGVPEPTSILLFAWAPAFALFQRRCKR